MAKKQQAPETIEKQFNKALFKTGEPVYFTWLGAKKYGHVTNHKQTNWGIQYTVTSDSTRYPCGIQIKEYRTQYAIGCIFFEETRTIGSTELNRRIAAGEQPRSNLQIYEKPTRPAHPSRNDDSNKRNVNRTSSTKNKSDSTGTNGLENGNESSPSRMQSNNTKKRKDVKLDSAIQRQRDFLNGFVKKD
jgi:hypothetical protein